MNDINNLKKYINIIKYVIKNIENDNDINDDIVKTVCLNVSENIDKIKNILLKRNLDDDSVVSDESTNNNICDTDDDEEKDNDEEEKDNDEEEKDNDEEEKDNDEEEKDNDEESIIYYQKYPNQKRKLEIFNKTIFIF